MSFWRVKVANRAGKSLKRFPKKEQSRLLLVIDSLAQDPYQGDLEKLEGELYLWRRRVGDYRIIFEILPRERRVDILDIRRKTSKTY